VWGARDAPFAFGRLPPSGGPPVSSPPGGSAPPVSPVSAVGAGASSAEVIGREVSPVPPPPQAAMSATTVKRSNALQCLFIFIARSFLLPAEARRLGS